jgi:hypothetical protein
MCGVRAAQDVFEPETPHASMTAIIACVSPGSTSVTHTLNTLRYVAPIRLALVKARAFALAPARCSQSVAAAPHTNDLMRLGGTLARSAGRGGSQKSGLLD